MVDEERIIDWNKSNRDKFGSSFSLTLFFSGGFWGFPEKNPNRQRNGPSGNGIEFFLNKEPDQKISLADDNDGLVDLLIMLGTSTHRSRHKKIFFFLPSFFVKTQFSLLDHFWIGTFPLVALLPSIAHSPLMCLLHDSFNVIIFHNVYRSISHWNFVSFPFSFCCSANQKTGNVIRIVCWYHFLLQ